jgi:hypothetical protein
VKRAHIFSKQEQHVDRSASRKARSRSVYQLGLGWVAQSVERGTHKPEVVGSKPTPATIKKLATSRGREMASRKAHNLEIGGSSPPPATKRVRGVAGLTRLPVTEKTAGSNPVGPARTKNISLITRCFLFCKKKEAITILRLALRSFKKTRIFFVKLPPALVFLERDSSQFL